MKQYRTCLRLVVHHQAWLLVNVQRRIRVVTVMVMAWSADGKSDKDAAGAAEAVVTETTSDAGAKIAADAAAAVDADNGKKRKHADKDIIEEVDMTKRQKPDNGSAEHKVPVHSLIGADTAMLLQDLCHACCACPGGTRTGHGHAYQATIDALCSASGTYFGQAGTIMPVREMQVCSMIQWLDDSETSRSRGRRVLPGACFKGSE
jgi:hypothetical protein